VSEGGRGAKGKWENRENEEKFEEGKGRIE